MIDAKTGEILFSGLLICPTTTREGFLAAPFAADAEPVVENPPWRSYRIEAVDESGQRFAFIAFFADERLTRVSMSCCDPGFGRSWAEWSEEKELERKAWHDAWLKRTSGIAAPADYLWGQVSSNYDRRSGGSSVLVAYTPASS